MTYLKDKIKEATKRIEELLLLIEYWKKQDDKND